MYCKNCGQKNSENQNYCQACGHSIKNNEIDPENLKFQESKDDFCKKCGAIVQARYCSECGTLGYKLEMEEGKASKYFQSIKKPGSPGALDDIKEKFKESGIADIKNIADIKEKFNPKKTLKSSSIAALKILGIGLVISFVLFFVISKTSTMKELLYGIDMAARSTYAEISNLKPNFVDFFNTALMAPINIVGKFQSNAWDETITAKAKGLINFKFIILLLIPIIGVLLSEFKTFRNEKSTKENLTKYAVTSLIFSIIVKIIALINIKTVRIQDSYEIINMKLHLTVQNFWSLLSVFLIIFFIHIVLSMIFKKDSLFKALDEKIGFDLTGNTRKYMKNMLLYVLIILAGFTLMYVFANVKARVSMKTLPLLLLLFLPSTFVKTWLFPFGNTMETLAIPGRSAAYGFKTVWRDFGLMKHNLFGMETAWVYLGYLFIILIFLGLIYVIFKSVKDIKKEGYFKNLAFLGGAISLINMLLSYLVSLGIKVTSTLTSRTGSLDEMFYYMDFDFLNMLSEPSTLKQYFPLFKIILLTFIWVFAIGGIIYLIKENKVYNGVKGFIERHNIKIIIAYLLVILVLAFLIQFKLLGPARYSIMDRSILLDMFY